MNPTVGSLDAALKFATHLFIESARRTGRTTLMIEQVKHGDVVLCPNAHVRHHIQRLLNSRGVHAQARECKPFLSAMYEVCGQLPMSYKVHADHTFIEDLYQERVDGFGRAINEAFAQFNKEKPDDPSPTPPHRRYNGLQF